MLGHVYSELEISDKYNILQFLNKVIPIDEKLRI